MKTILEELKSPLYDVQRAWIRKPAVIFNFSIFLIIVFVLVFIMTLGYFTGKIQKYFMYGYEEFIGDCWKGPKDID